MLKNPFDIAVAFAIISLVVITVGFGISSVEEQGANVGTMAFFTSVETDVYSNTGLKGTSDEASDVIDPSDEPVTAEASEENIITQGLQSLRSMGSTYKSVETVMKNATTELGIDEIYWNILAYTIIIILFVIIYTWARGVA